MREHVEQALGHRIKRCVLLNDFVAVGLGLQALTAEEHGVSVATLHDAPVQPKAACMCLGPGTGLGTCFLTWDDSVKGYVAHPAEGGQPTFGARTKEEFELCEFISAEGGGRQVIVEDVVSGPGLGNCFRFRCSMTCGVANSPLLAATNDADLPAAVAALALAGGRGVRVRGRDTCMEGEGTGSLEDERRCEAALELWCEAFLGELRAAALRYLPHGGLYIAGGVASKLMPWLGEAVGSKFAAEGGVNGALLGRIPVVLVDDAADPGLLGAKVRALRVLEFD